MYCATHTITRKIISLHDSHRCQRLGWGPGSNTSALRVVGLATGTIATVLAKPITY